MRSFSYADFVSKVKSDGLAHQNRFYISIQMPRKLYGESAFLFDPTEQQNKRDLHLLCKSVSMPGVQVQTTNTTIIGETYDLPTNRIFSGCSLIFYVDKKMIVRQFFEDWVNTIQDPTTRELSFYDDYVVNIEIYVMNKSEKAGPDYKITLHDAFPKTVGQLTLDQENNQIMLFDINFTYHNYTTTMLDSIVSNASGSPDSFSFNKNLPSEKSRLPGALDATTFDNKVKTIVPNAIKNVFGNYSNVLKDYNNNFVDFQEMVNKGNQILSGTGIPIESILSGDIRNITGRAKEFARGEGREIARQGISAVFGDRLKLARL